MSRKLRSACNICEEIEVVIFHIFPRRIKVSEVTAAIPDSSQRKFICEKMLLLMPEKLWKAHCKNIQNCDLVKSTFFNAIF